ncbi:RNA-directed DNA polymerase, eukaryota [Tanacetum coccineum]
MGDRGSFNSKEDLTQKIPKTVFVTNFPDHFSARDLWNVCVAYGKVIDVYIPLKKSKAGKKFAFVPFLKVDNLDRLIDNLCTIWIGRFRLHANSVRFQRETKAYSSQPKKGNEGSVKNTFASVLKSGKQKPIISDELSPAIVLDDSCLMEKDFSCSLMGKIKDINALSNLYVILANEGFENVKLTYLGGFWVLIDSESLISKEKIRNHVGVASWFHELLPTNNSFASDERIVWISVEGLPIKTLTRNTCVKTKPSVIINDKIKVIVKGQVYWIRVKELEAWIPDFGNELEDNSSADEEFEDVEEEHIKEKKE